MANYTAAQLVALYAEYGVEVSQQYVADDLATLNSVDPFEANRLAHHYAADEAYTRNAESREAAYQASYA